MPDGPIPEYLLKENSAKTGGEFDPNVYFTVLPHLSMEQGYVLDYVYFYGSGEDQAISGEPVLYARRIEQPPYQTYSEFLAAEGDKQSGSWSRFFDHIQVDGTEEGFLELAVLMLVGLQFYQYEPAHHTELICDRAELDAVLSHYPDLAAAGTQKLLNLDVEPKIEFSDSTVSIQVIVFTCSKLGGLDRLTYTLNRGFPHNQGQDVRAQDESLTPLVSTWPPPTPGQ